MKTISIGRVDISRIGLSAPGTSVFYTDAGRDEAGMAAIDR